MCIWNDQQILEDHTNWSIWRTSHKGLKLQIEIH
jgi:hypothetical protein